jgi:ankyrin repeat protein
MPARTGNIEAVRLMLEAGCDPNLHDGNRNSALCEVVYAKNHLELAKLLIDAGADVNQMEPYSPFGDSLEKRVRRANYSPLEMAVFHKRWDLAEYLLARGANIDIETGDGERLVKYFRRLERHDAVEWLINHGAIGL